MVLAYKLCATLLVTQIFAGSSAEAALVSVLSHHPNLLQHMSRSDYMRIIRETSLPTWKGSVHYIIGTSVSILSFFGISSHIYISTQQQQFVNIRGESKPQAVVYQYSSQCRALIYNTPGPSTMDVRRSLPSLTHIASPPNRSSTPLQHIGLILYMRISLQGPTLSWESYSPAIKSFATH